jgi:uncharacterized protein YjbJ (UPF0337 family)
VYAIFHPAEGCKRAASEWKFLEIPKQTTRELPMKGSTKNRVRGKLRQVKGKAKQKAGQLTRNTRLETEGLDDQVAGTIQNLGGRIQKKLEE